nr:hypothetical protein [uncultured Pseudomonas sp.]
MTHRLYAWLFCLLAIALHPGVSAATPEQQAALHQIRLSIIGSLGDFYLLYGVTVDPAHGASIEKRIALVDQQLGRLEATGGALLSTLEQLQPHWRAYRALLSEAAIQLQRKQDPEGGAIAELIRLNRHLINLCDELSAGLDRDQAHDSRALEVRLQTLTTDYIAHSVGANSLGGDAPAVDEQSKAFAAGLQQLRQQPGQSAERQLLLRDIEKTWRYIEPSLLNYRENSVPTLVNRYSARITAALGQLAAEPQASAP